jgi:hypothetical protein
LRDIPSPRGTQSASPADSPTARSWKQLTLAGSIPKSSHNCIVPSIVISPGLLRSVAQRRRFGKPSVRRFLGWKRVDSDPCTFPRCLRASSPCPSCQTPRLNCFAKNRPSRIHLWPVRWLRMIIWFSTVTKLNDDLTYALQIVRILLEKSQRIVGANGSTRKQRQTGTSASAMQSTD